MSSFNKTYWRVFLTKNFKVFVWWVSTMKKFLGIDKTPPALEGSFKAATKLGRDLSTDLEMESIPPEELSSLVENIHIKT